MIDYFSIPELPDRQMFYCERRSCVLQVSTCAAQWKQANCKARSECSYQCQTCPVGAQHAGEGDVTMSHLRGKEICSRCHRVGLRLIYGDICVSCFNRQREHFVKRNARGRPPVNHPPIHPYRAAVLCGGKVTEVRKPNAIDMTELIVSQLRDRTRQVYFAMALPRPLRGEHIPVQGELF